MMGVVRTPDERFVGLPGYSFEPRYADVTATGVEPVRMHFVDSGPADGSPVVLLHGQPTWSYLYRKMIPVLNDSGLRTIAPDNIGFGRSDKLTERTDYTFQRHVEWMTSFFNAVDLKDATLVVQDWGGPIGLSALAAVPDRFSRIVATNTVLHTSDPDLSEALTWANYALGDGRVVLEEALVDYVLFCQRTPDLVPSMFVDASAGPLPDDVKAAYDAPFPDATYEAGLRQMTSLIPLTRKDPGASIGRRTWHALRSWEKPLLTAFSDADPATGGWAAVLQARVPGARGRTHPIIVGAGHFIQEQQGEQLAATIVDFIQATQAAHRSKPTF
jgi:haloalkane dehalogenase